MNKKNIIIVVAVLSLVGVAFFLLKKANSSVDLKKYEKYSLAISIDSKDPSFTPIALGIKDDGKSAKINSSMVNLESYIVGANLYYLKGSSMYVFSGSKSYRDIYELLNSFKFQDMIQRQGELEFYSLVLSPKEINALLECLYFGKKTNRDALLKATIKDERLEEASISIEGFDGYDEINIVFKVKELEKSFVIDTSKIYGSGPFGTTFKRIETDENVYDIIK